MDRSLRDAERSGDGVALLRARLRAGELTEAHVELTASLGHADARVLCPDVELVEWPNAPYVESALEQAAAMLGDDTVVHRVAAARIAADWAERVLPLWEAAHPDDAHPREAIAAARAWAACPCDDHRQAAYAASSAGALNSDFNRAAWAAGLVATGGFPAAAHAALSVAAFAAANAARFAIIAAVANAADSKTALATEREWQQLRLAAYVLGEVEEAANE